MRTVLLFIATGMICLALAAPAVAADAKIVIDGSTTVGPIAKALAEYYMAENPGVNLSVSESGSGNGAKSLINGACDIADMSRFMKAEEFKAAVAAGVMPVAHAVAVDGIAVIVHPSNRVKNLTVEQIAAIYKGEVTNWKQLGGADVPIVKVSRDTNSGTFESFAELVMKGERVAGDAETAASNGQIRARVQSTQAAIGYVGLGFVDRTVKAVKVNDIAPSRGTIASGVYPIARPLFMFTNGYPKLGTPLYAFVNLYHSEKGQEIIESIGFVPLTEY